MYQTDDLCPICIKNNNEYVTECNHYYCLECLCRINKCALCRKVLNRSILCKEIINDFIIKRKRKCHDEPHELTSIYPPRFSRIDTAIFLMNYEETINSFRYKTISEFMTDAINFGRNQFRKLIHIH